MALNKIAQEETKVHTVGQVVKYPKIRTYFHGKVLKFDRAKLDETEVLDLL